MAFILKNGIWRKDVMPTIPVELDRNSPFTQGLVDSYVFCNGAGPPKNFGNTGNVATLTSGPGYKSTPGGIGGYGNGGKYFTLPVIQINAGSIDWTMRLRFMSVSSTGGFMAVADSVGGSAFFTIGGGGAASFGGAYGINFAGTYPIGTICDVVFVGQASGAFPGFCYANGVQAGTNTPWNAVPPAPIALGNNVSGGGSNPDVVYFSLDTWQRRLTNDEIAHLYVEPFMLKEKISRQFYFLSSNTDGGSITGSAAWTEAQDTWAGTGAVAIDGSAAWTEGPDIWAGTGTVVSLITGTAAWTEAPDVWAGTGAVLVSGSAAWTEGPDIWSGTGIITLPDVTGVAAWTEAADSWAGTGNNGQVQTGGHFIPLTRKQEQEIQKRRRKERKAQEAAWDERRIDADSIAADMRAQLLPSKTIAEVINEVTEAEDDDDADIEWLLLTA